MKSKKILKTASLVLGAMCVLGCNDKEPVVDASVEPQSDVQVDTQDGSQSGCEQRTVKDVKFLGTTDIDIQFQATLEGEDNLTMAIVYQFVSEATYMGTYDLSQEPPYGFGLGFCAHCFAMSYEDAPLRPDRGTLVQNVHPFSRKLDIEVSNLRFIEWDIDTRAVKPDGKCIEIADFTVNEQFVAARWTCEAEKYNDGSECHCACGDFDPDCSASPLCTLESQDPECTRDRTAVDCLDGTVCGNNLDPNPQLWAPQCVSTCDWRARTPCAAGACVAKGMATGQCIDQEEIFDDATLDMPCSNPGNLVKHCAVDADGFALGICNDLFPEYLCSRICTSDDECPKNDETCMYFFNKEDGIGFCSKPAPDDG